ncbi:MAG TPA: M13 family metallopeptidase [Thermoanaerobaculia bacterium]|jgi:endothelin-converting enzyme/putative endopeptidase|nr:M13 family metallopeptidase [Thermoanaerobaculia bacterium]
MGHHFRPVALSALLIAGQAMTAFAQTPPPASGMDAAKAEPLAAPAFDVSLIDRSVQPCDDFYQFTCGGWIAKNPVPPDRSRWGRFDELSEYNQMTMRGILEKTSKQDPKRAAIDQKIGDYYASCMDEAGIEAKGLAPLKAMLAPIDGLKSKKDLAPVLAVLHRDGVPALFNFGAGPDFKNASMNIASADQSGLGLPDRDYYLGDEPRLATVREQYPAHVQRMFELMGDSKEAAAQHAKTVMEIETALAKASLDRVKRREPTNRYHKMGREQLAVLAPSFDWNAYVKATGAPAFTEVNIGWPDFLKGMNEVLETRSLDDLKTYLRWQTVHRAAPLLPTAFVNEDWSFYQKTLAGAKELRPRWRRCVELTDRQLGEALGQRYVEATFGPEGKARMAKMVQALEAALERDIRSLDWMTDPTKAKAIEKLAAIGNKIGYPEKWRDYSAYKIVRGDALGNATRGAAFAEARNLSKIGQKVDPLEWRTTPPTVNASYSPPENFINFPAGILQPPFFDKEMDDAVNFGGIGGVIGHELTHGFDDQGRKFDAKGNLTDWWTAEDGTEFEKRVSCIADQYTAYTVSDGVHLNGRLTLGENTADNGGLRIALMALQDTLKGKQAPLRDGFTPEQRVFLGWAQVWCQNATPEGEKLRVQTDPHSPGKYRVNGPVSNMPEFQKAFNCPAGAPMVRENACRVW